MSKIAFDKIAEGLKEALAIARADAKPASRRILSKTNVRSLSETQVEPIKGKRALSKDD